MLNIILLLIGILLMLIGCVTVFLPIPGGVLPLLFGMILLITVSPFMRQSLRRARLHYAWLNTQCFRAEKTLQKRFPAIANALAKTRPPLQ